MVNTQWRTGTVGQSGILMTVYIGLDYQAVMSIAALHKIKLNPIVFGRLQSLERFEMQRQVKKNG